MRFFATYATQSDRVDGEEIASSLVLLAMTGGTVRLAMTGGWGSEWRGYYKIQM